MNDVEETPRPQVEVKRSAKKHSECERSSDIKEWGMKERRIRPSGAFCDADEDPSRLPLQPNSRLKVA